MAVIAPVIRWSDRQPSTTQIIGNVSVCADKAVDHPGRVRKPVPVDDRVTGHQGARPGQYFVTVTDSKGCTGVDWTRSEQDRAQCQLISAEVPSFCEGDFFHHYHGPFMTNVCGVMATPLKTDTCVQDVVTVTGTNGSLGLGYRRGGRQSASCTSHHWVLAIVPDRWPCWMPDRYASTNGAAAVNPVLSR